jgi:hypothetical protein
MSTGKRLTATVGEDPADALDKAEEESFGSRTQAEREALKRGLQEMGYLDRPDEAHEQLLWVVNKVGLGLGFVGLLAIGVGIFGPRLASFVGFGVTLGGMLLLVVEAVLEEHTDSLGGDLL